MVITVRIDVFLLQKDLNYLFTYLFLGGYRGELLFYLYRWSIQS
jgi:hypothetical protein